jgi:glycosyltransferase involved in cell wall biosynthesis
VISFVVPAHNEQQLIGQAVSSIREAADAEQEDHEIIVVNDSSTDDTASIAANLGARVIDVAHRQIAATRNAGARSAAGDFFFFVDADTMATRKALRAALRALRNGAVGGGCNVRFEQPLPFYGKVIERFISPALQILRLAPGCFIYCTRQAYFTAGGFDETLFCTEEVAFAQQLKRQGPFVIVRDFVVTSPRKLRNYSAMQFLLLAIRMSLRGEKAMHQREGLDYWYGPRE